MRQSIASLPAPSKKWNPSTVLCFFLLIKWLLFTYFGILLFFWECSSQQMLLPLALIAKQDKGQQQCHPFPETQLEKRFSQLLLLVIITISSWFLKTSCWRPPKQVFPDNPGSKPLQCSSKSQAKPELGSSHLQLQKAQRASTPLFVKNLCFFQFQLCAKETTDVSQMK